MKTTIYGQEIAKKYILKNTTDNLNDNVTSNEISVTFE